MSISCKWSIRVGAFFGALLVSNTLLASGDRGLLHPWSAPALTVQERAAAVNRAFTNGTPIPVIIAVLGTNYTHYYSPISTAWLGPGPEPRKMSGFQYHFGHDRVIIGTTADLNANPLTGKFTGAGYSISSAQSAPTTNRIWIGQPHGAFNRSQPIRSAPNGTPTGAGSGP